MYGTSLHATTAAASVAPATGAATHGGTASLATGVVALLVVIGLIFLLARLARRLPGLSVAAHPDLRVVGALALGPRDRLVVVQVGDRQVLLGIGPQGTRQLHTLDRPLAQVEGTGTSFADLLAKRFRGDGQ